MSQLNPLAQRRAIYCATPPAQPARSREALRFMHTVAHDAACQPSLTVADAWNDVIGTGVQKGIRYIPPVRETVPKGCCPEGTCDPLAEGPAGQVVEDPRSERAAYRVSDARWAAPDTWHLSVW